MRRLVVVFLRLPLLLLLTGGPHLCSPGANNAQYLDKLQVERDRGITVKAQTATLLHRHQGGNYLLNLIDTPGHVDFSYEVSRSLAACQGALLLVDASQGIQVRQSPWGGRRERMEGPDWDDATTAIATKEGVGVISSSVFPTGMLMCALLLSYDMCLVT